MLDKIDFNAEEMAQWVRALAAQHKERSQICSINVTMEFREVEAGACQAASLAPTW